MQMRLRASTGLFAALEHCDNPIEITDAEKIIQVHTYMSETRTSQVSKIIISNFFSS